MILEGKLKLEPYFDVLHQARERGDLEGELQALIAMADIAERYGCTFRADHYRKLANDIPVGVVHVHKFSEDEDPITYAAAVDETDDDDDLQEAA